MPYLLVAPPLLKMTDSKSHVAISSECLKMFSLEDGLVIDSTSGSISKTLDRRRQSEAL